MSLRILVCVDESAFSVAAGEVALDLSRRVDEAELEAITVVPVTTASGNPFRDLPGTLGFEPAIVSPEVYAEHQAAGEELLKRLADRAAAFGAPIKTEVRSGQVAETIAHAARHADLVVMGLRGHTEERFPGQGGNTTASLFQDLPRLLLVPKGMTALRTFAIGYDGSVAAAHAVTALRQVSEGWSPVVHAIYVSEDGTGGEVLDELDEELPHCELHKHTVVGDAPREAVMAKAGALGCDTLVLGFKGSHPLRDILLGSTSERALGQLDLAVLVAR